MKKIKGIQIKHLGFDPIKQGDFIYHEGPLLSHFVDKNNPSDNYFYRWVDYDDNTNRWLIFRLSDDDLAVFFKNQLNLKQLISKNSFTYLLDLDAQLNKVQILLVSLGDLPSVYLPQDNSYFDEEQYENHALSVKNNLLRKEYEILTYEKILQEVALLKEQQSKTYSLLENIMGRQFNPT
jgi:hypothetical protein